MKYISRNEKIQDYIILSGNDDLIEAVYFLFLHHKCSLEYFLKNLFYREFEKSRTLIFRQNSRSIILIIDFLKKYACNFHDLAIKICNISKDNSIVTNPKKMKKTVAKVVECIDEQFISYFGETLIDFCCDINIFLNSKIKDLSDKYAPEKLVCSFIFFNIFISQIIDVCPQNDRPHVVPVVKIINAIASGINEKPYHKYAGYQEKIKNLVARALMQRKKANYCFEYILPTEQYENNRTKLLIDFMRELSKTPKSDPAKSFLTRSDSDTKLISSKKINKQNRNSVTFSEEETNIIDQATIKISTNIKNNQIYTSPCLEHTQSFKYLLSLALVSPNVNYLKTNLSDDDFRYFLLWSNDKILAMAITWDLDCAFLKKWNINGETFLQLDNNTLSLMGLTNQTKINKIIECVKNIRTKAYCDLENLKPNVIQWDKNDLAIWLILSGLSHLVDIFIKYELCISKIINFTGKDYLEMGITQPRDIFKLTLLIPK